jgi:16S rRNA (cytidine1402-2'-O)-methyltransferase
VDIVAAEDTRTTQKLFNILGIRNKMVSNHKFNEKRQSDHLISELLQGKNVAIVSDAGTPCISDPGHVIVKNAVAEGIDVIGICGASSVMAALSVSGFNFISFAFYGFFPRENNSIRGTLQSVKGSGFSVSVFFESPKRIEKVLKIILEELPDADLCLCNDLTKMYEKIYRGKPKDVLEDITNNPAADKGEYTLVIQSNFCLRELEKTSPGTADDVELSREAMLIDYIVKNEGSSMKDAIQALQGKYKGTISKKEFYTAALNLKELLPRLYQPETHNLTDFELEKKNH